VSDSRVGRVILGISPNEITLLKNSVIWGEEGQARDKRFMLKSPDITID
jgi:hypothetical protein